MPHRPRRSIRPRNAFRPGRTRLVPGHRFLTAFTVLAGLQQSDRAFSVDACLQLPSAGESSRRRVADAPERHKQREGTQRVVRQIPGCLATEVAASRPGRESRRMVSGADGASHTTHSTPRPPEKFIAPRLTRGAFNPLLFAMSADPRPCAAQVDRRCSASDCFGLALGRRCRRDAPRRVGWGTRQSAPAPLTRPGAWHRRVQSPMQSAKYTVKNWT